MLKGILKVKKKEKKSYEQSEMQFAKKKNTN